MGMYDADFNFRHVRGIFTVKHFSSFNREVCTDFKWWRGTHTGVKTGGRDNRSQKLKTRGSSSVTVTFVAKWGLSVQKWDIYKVHRQIKLSSVSEWVKGTFLLVSMFCVFMQKWSMWEKRTENFTLCVSVCPVVIKTHTRTHRRWLWCAEFGRYVVFLIYYRYHVSVATFSLQHLQIIDGKISKIRKNVMNFQSFIEYIYEYNHCLHCCAAAGEYPYLSTRVRHTLRWFSFY